jgi:HSP20 family protein
MCAAPIDPNDLRDPFDDAMFFGDDLIDLFETHRPFGRSETGFLAGRSFRPAADIFESPDGLVIILEVPGIEKSQINVEVDGNHLIVSGSRDFVKDNLDEEYVRLERGFGSFRRVFELPLNIDAESVKAKLENGVLTLKLPRKKEVRVAIQTGGTFE